ncbi:exonuclease domain-containing protein [Sphingomonas sp. Y38-1Y]|uniref:exonuclease domain-containing protein n=1 Tax=Sphingomonas sp. Y38-1Y TaxID=3078265 RepID=UPI0028F0531F|nr:exonuclease domain-containing protein [Sphingomonas sp. Y38-1Y]
MNASSQADRAPDFVVIDVETACSRTSSICQVGIVGFRDGQEVFAWETLLDPCDEFHAGNTRIHGIAAHHVVGQPIFADVHATIDAHLTGRITVAHSLFDKGAIAAACRLHDRTPIETRWLDSVRVAREAWPDLENHKLGNLARFLSVPHRHHDALSDARAAGWVIVRAIEHTGTSLAEWMAPPRPVGPAPRAAADGPYLGERIAILGQPRDGPIAHAIAALGGTIHSSVGLTTTMLVVARAEPFGRSVLANAGYRRALKAIADGRRLRIVSAQALGLA